MNPRQVAGWRVATTLTRLRTRSRRRSICSISGDGWFGVVGRPVYECVVVVAYGG